MSATTDQIDAVLGMLWPAVVGQQDAYYAQHGCYYQMLWTHSQIPSAPAAPDNLDARPTDQPPHPVADLPPTMRSRFKIDTYGKPDGWSLTLQTKDGELVFHRIVDCGVDSSRNVPWTVS